MGRRVTSRVFSRAVSLVVLLAVFAALPAVRGEEDPLHAGPPLIDGHRLLLKTGKELTGILLNPEAKEGPHELKTPGGMRSIPRDVVARVIAEKIPVTHALTTEEAYQRFLKEIGPEKPAGHVELADLCLRTGAYARAKEHYAKALEDAAFAESAEAATIRRRIQGAEVLAKYQGLRERVALIKKLAFHKRFKAALEELAALRKEIAGDELANKILDLDRLEKDIVQRRRKHFTKEVARLLPIELKRRVSAKVREKKLEVRDAVSWAQSKSGLKAELMEAIAKKVKIAVEDVEGMWTARAEGRLRRFSYRSGTFIHPSVAGKKKPKKRPKKGERVKKPKSATTWWEGSGTKERAAFITAWFAEYAGMYRVIRFEQRTCSPCGGRGAGCAGCNHAGHERIVVCR